MTDKTRAFGQLIGKTALVTGASSGIGKEIAIEFARAGADVHIHYATSQKLADEVAATIRALGQKCVVFQHDFLNGEFHEFAAQTWEHAGPIDIWVNNAGVDLLTGPGKSLSYENKLQRLLQVDVTSTVLLGKFVGHLMQSRGSGNIINIGWDQADRGMGGDSGELFAVSKNAIMGLTRSLAVSLAPQVRVNCIAPGWIQTAWGEQTSSDWHQRVLAETPLNRWGLPRDIAKLARFLASDDADYFTGQVINANGGAIR